MASRTKREWIPDGDLPSGGYVRTVRVPEIRQQTEAGRIAARLNDSDMPDSDFCRLHDQLRKIAPVSAAGFDSRREAIDVARTRDAEWRRIAAVHADYVPTLAGMVRERFPDQTDEQARRWAEIFLSPEQGVYDTLEDAVIDFAAELDEAAQSED